MLKQAKWVKASQASEPVSHVAAAVVRERLELVWHFAPLAAEQWEDHPEYLHQMRVATRRSAAALATFAELLPKKKSRHMQKRLKRLRKASGQARDLDVLVGRVLDAARPIVQPLRRAAQQPVAEAIEKLRLSEFPQKLDALCERIRWRGEGAEPTYADEARRLLSSAIDDFLAAMEEDLTDHATLHALRIEGKQLRYTLELLSGVLGSKFRQELYVSVRDLQDKLGEINDHAAAAQRFHDWSSSAAPEVSSQFLQLAAAESARSQELQQSFLNWWTNKRRRQFAKKLQAAAAG